ncbi:MAG: transglycosylase SLT domain-containing protein [Deltaproteobacteria bacterium]|nr:transglycosylase SLT domain-containing protein [Deltaproteobacteria bacterium]
MHTQPKTFKFSLPLLPRFFLILAAGALIMGGFTACVPLENQSVTMVAPEPLPRATKQKAAPTAVKPESPPPRVEKPAPAETDPQALKLAVSPEISELAHISAWDVLPLLSTGEETESYDFPLKMNDQVEYYLDFFTNRHRKTFARWLARSARYLPMIKEEFAKAGLPMDLAYLPMIESGFNTTVSSRASAVGTWQFMRATGQNYGLKVNNYVDERRDPVKSTKAAAAYLAKLYKQFDSWHLAVAAYNAGEGKISRAMKQSDSDDFWEIAQSQYIHSETKLYVPQLIAAIMIAKDPEKYGFDRLDWDEPLDYEIVNVPCGTPIKAVALACNLPDEEILALNRHLSKSITPPSEADYPLRVPQGKKELVIKNLPRVHTVMVTEFNTHEVKRGETLTTISKKYKLSKTTLLKANNLEQERLSLGQHLRIPYQATAYRLGDEPLHLARAVAANIPLFSIRTEPSDTKAHKKNKSRSSKKEKSAELPEKRVLSSSSKEKKSATPNTKEKTTKSPEPSPKKSGPGKKK